MPLLWKPSPKGVVSLSPAEEGKPIVRFRIKKDPNTDDSDEDVIPLPCYVVEEDPKIRVIRYKDWTVENEIQSVHVFRIWTPWVYFLAIDGLFAIVFAKGRLRGTHHQACYDAPLPNTTSAGSFWICTKGWVKSEDAALAVYERFWSTTFNVEINELEHHEYPRELLGGSCYWFTMMTAWHELTRERKARKISWIPLRNTLYDRGGPQMSLYDVACCMDR